MAPGLRRAVPTSSMPRSWRSLRTASSSTMRSFTSSRPVWSASRVGARHVDVELVGGALGPREPEHGVEPALDPAALHVLLRHPLEAAELLAERAHHLVGHAGGLERVDALAVVVGGLAVVLVAELLADGVHLAAEDVLALLLVEAVADLVADLLGELALGEGLLGPPEHEAHPLGDVDRLEQLDLALERQLRPPADQVGQAAGVVGVDRAQDAAHLPVAEVLEQRDQGGAQLGAERLGLVGGAVARSPARR